MPPRRPHPPRLPPPWIVPAAIWLAVAIGPLAAARADQPPQARIEMADGSALEGGLQGIGGDELQVVTASGVSTLPLARVRRIAVQPPEAAAARPHAVTVTTVTGSRIVGDDFTWTGETATVVRGAGQVELPIGLVQMVAWRRSDDDDREPAWLPALPEKPDSDLVIVGGGPDVECVACAITGVSADRVTVVLEGETIPVQRAKVAGLRWLRPAAGPAGRIGVTTTSGRFEAGDVAWSSAGLVLDGRIRMPADWLVEIDYAAARTVRLATVEPERLDVEPFFAGLGSITGVASFFRPRGVQPPADDGPPALLMRPRTVGVWRVPADSRRFQATLRPAGEAPPRAIVAIELDGREVFRERIDGQPASVRDAPAVPIDLDLTGTRRLTLTVDFAAGGPGGAIRLDDARFEK